jgi:hypothetical protein
VFNKIPQKKSGDVIYRDVGGHDTFEISQSPKISSSISTVVLAVLTHSTILLNPTVPFVKFQQGEKLRNFGFIYFSINCLTK